MNLPFVTVIIPMRNEINYIKQSLMSVINCDYPEDRYEIIIVNGMSTDGSKEFVQSFLNKYKNSRLLKNPKKITPAAFNIGIRASKSEFICIISGHGYIEKDFLKNGIKYLLENPDIDCVGGPAIAVANNFFGKLVALVTSSKFGTGSFFRYGTKDRFIDTVPFPILRRNAFNKAGYYNEKLARNQDNEFNYRLRKNGGKIYFLNNMKAYVYVRSDLLAFIYYTFTSGRWNVYTNRLCKHAFAIRHFIPFLFVIGLVISFILASFSLFGKVLLFTIMICYLIVNLISSFQICIKNGWQYYPFLPFIFSLFHLSYGLGTFWGLIINWKPKQ